MTATATTLTWTRLDINNARLQGPDLNQEEDVQGPILNQEEDVQGPILNQEEDVLRETIPLHPLLLLQREYRDFATQFD